MNDKPIIFSGPMVRAIIEGRKTQTRRLAKARWTSTCGANPDKAARTVNDFRFRPGCRLWVKETFVMWPLAGDDCAPGPVYRESGQVTDAAIRLLGRKWRPSIFMPQEFSRITLEVTASRIERLQTITSEDALAEGVQRFSVGVLDPVEVFGVNSPAEFPSASAVDCFRAIWNSINGKKARWSSNPWVEVVTFRLVI
jgi:hypothetical protein